MIRQLERYFLVLCTLGPALLAMGVYLYHGDDFGSTGIWCWVTDDTVVRFAFWYGPLVALLLIMGLSL